MKELVMHIVKALVDNPDEVTIEETVEKDEIILKLKVSHTFPLASALMLACPSTRHTTG